jgi:putative colanic acid biosynthesis acetyltransferase WcaF
MTLTGSSSARAEPGQSVPCADDQSELRLDIAANRAAQKYSRSEQLRRVAWSLGSWLVRLSPRPCFGWRRAVLRLFGARIAQGVHIYPSAYLYMPWNVEIGAFTALGENVLVYSLGPVRIGANVTVSYRSHLCAGTHDFADPALPLLKCPVTVEDGAWIGTEAFVGPSVTVRAGAIVGARAVVVKDVESLAIVAGNPARVIGRRSNHSQSVSAR